MDRNKERVLALALLCALLIVGVVCYITFPSKSPDLPVRILMSTGGMADKVIFTHDVHAGEDYGLSCLDCHHTADDEESEMEKCSDCHMDEADEDDDTPALMDAYHDQCIGCHEDANEELTECAACHVK